ncbi:hypothetical protein GCM10010116_57130 [Microbispora rosea subsp. aerata]|nr:hypothetical protein GCM10010116_57130 [Microbispora rosea subsp. aerata]GIH58895.1 hypothetical protein Mro02_58090 [Microbispora rosea subsp. aerata]GLJ87231.1 hypothetical protein GCM10017588_59760 [Microbispora rosea subsp. aerata]
MTSAAAGAVPPSARVSCNTKPTPPTLPATVWSNVFTVTDAGACFTGSCDGAASGDFLPRDADADFELAGEDDTPGDGTAPAPASGAATVTGNPGTATALPGTTSTLADPLFGHTGAGSFFAGRDAFLPMTRGVGVTTGRPSTLRSG